MKSMGIVLSSEMPSTSNPLSFYLSYAFIKFGFSALKGPSTCLKIN